MSDTQDITPTEIEVGRATTGKFAPLVDAEIMPPHGLLVIADGTLPGDYVDLSRAVGRLRSRLEMISAQPPNEAIGHYREFIGLAAGAEEWLLKSAHRFGRDQSLLHEAQRLRRTAVHLCSKLIVALDKKYPAQRGLRTTSGHFEGATLAGGALAGERAGMSSREVREAREIGRIPSAIVEQGLAQTPPASLYAIVHQHRPRGLRHNNLNRSIQSISLFSQQHTASAAASVPSFGGQRGKELAAKARAIAAWLIEFAKAVDARP